MFERPRLSAACVVLAASVAVFICALPAQAYTTTDLNNWNLTESTVYWGSGPSQFHTSAGSDGAVSYRWLDTPSKATVIGATGCFDLANYGFISIAVNSTTYQQIFSAPGSSTCWFMRGHTTSGSGSMNDHDGRVQR